MFTKKECAIIHDAIHLGDLHNFEKSQTKTTLMFGKKKNSYVKYNQKDIWTILKKVVEKMSR